MSATANEPRSWSRRRWATTIAVVLAGQLVLVFLLSESAPRPTPARAAGGLFKLVPSGAARQMRELPWIGDPAQFALVSPQGFSGPIWLQRPRFEPRVMDWSEPPRWLSQEVANLGVSFSAVPARPEERGPAIAQRPASPSSVLPQFAEPALTNSTLRLEGDLASRPLVKGLDLPRWPHPDILLPSTVQVVVDGGGRVLSATLLSGSGLEAADRRALELARAARFKPLATPAPGGGWCWGRLIFQWQALEESGPNQPVSPGNP